MKKETACRRIIASVIAFVMVLTFILGNLTSDMVRAEEKVQYISDIRIFQSGSLERSIAMCKAAGYIPLESDLNHGGGGDYVLLGYKTTEDRTDAITDLSVLQMGSGYEIRSYEEILQYQLPRFELLAQEVYSILPDFRKNLEKKSPSAEMALKVLNYYYYDDEEMLFGDFLLSEKCDRDSEAFDPDILPHILQCGASSLVNILFSALIPAAADYNPDAEYIPGDYAVSVEKAPEMPVDFNYMGELMQDTDGAEEAELPAEPSDEPEQTGETELTEENPDSPEETEPTAENPDSPAETEPTEENPDIPEETEPTEENPDSPAETEPTGENPDSPEETEPTAENPDSPAETKLTGEDPDSPAETELTGEDPDAAEENTQPQTEDTAEPSEEDFEPEVEEEEALLKCDMNYGNWASRISKTGMVEMYENGEIDDEVINLYNSSVRLIKKSVQDFASHYLDATARLEAYGEEALMPEGATDDITAVGQDITVTGEDSEGNADLYYIQAYEILDQYEYNEEMSVAQYLVDIGSVSYLDDDYELLPFYPLAAALSSAQIYLMQIQGVAPLVMYLHNNDEVTKKADELFREIDSRLSDADLGETISVWAGIDRTKYDQRIAETNSTILRDKAGKNLTTFTSSRGALSALDSIVSIIQTVSTIVGAASAVISLASSVMVATGTLTAGITAASCWAYMWSGGICAFLLGGAGAAIMALGSAGMFISIGIMLYQIGVSIYRTHFYKEDYIDAAFDSEIPGMVLDSNDENALLYYYPAYKETPADDILNDIRKMLPWFMTHYWNNSLYGDLNGGNGRDGRWNALCWTKDEHAGSPLRLDADGNCFIMLQGSSLTPTGYTAVNNFNEPGAANLNSYSNHKNAPALYLYYITEDSLENPVSGGAEQLSKAPNYLKELKLVSGETAEDAESALQKDGFQPLTSNLNPQIESPVTMLGYKISSKVSDALTDIRVLQANDTTTAVPKDYTLLGETAAGDKLYTTNSITSGEPIVAEFQTISGLGSRAISYKPIRSFGSFPYDFKSCAAYDTESEEAGILSDENRLFITYKQTQKYLSSLELSSGRTREAALSALTRKGCQYVDRNLTPGTGVYTYLGYRGADTATNCITDIRILPAGVDFETVKNYDQYTLLDITENGDIIYYSTNEKLGNPITADFSILGAYEDADAGSRLISSFSDLAFDFAAAEEYQPPEALTETDFDAIDTASENEQAADEEAAENQNMDEYVPEQAVKDKIFISYTSREKPLYVSAVSVVSYYGNESAGKELLKSQGYNVIDINLTHDVYRTYTYFGYMTTELESSALRDIRVAPAYAATEARFGGASYGLGVGSNQKMGVTSQGDGLFQTAFASNGDPILADFIVVNDPRDAPAGYEPILTFGGLPYNFGRCKLNEGPMDFWSGCYEGNDLYKKYFEKIRAAYIYYRPSVAYPATNPDGSEATKYISGVSVLVGNDEDNTARKFASSYANRFGSAFVGDSASDDLIRGTDYGAKWYDVTETQVGGEAAANMIINYTYNPKRAVTDLCSYTANVDSIGITPFMGSPAAGAYASEDVILTMKTNNGSVRHTVPIQILGYSTTHDWLMFEDLTNGVYYMHNDDVMMNEDFEDAGYWTGTYSKGSYETAWEKSGLRYKTLYACGPTETGEPLRADELVIVNSTDGYEGNPDWKPVVDMRMPNATTPHNLSYRSAKGNRCNEIYMFLHRPLPAEEKYVSNVSLAVVNGKKAIMDALNNDGDLDSARSIVNGAYDTCLSTLRATSTDEIMPRNLNVVASPHYSNGISTNAIKFMEDLNERKKIGIESENDTSDWINYVIGRNVYAPDGHGGYKELEDVDAGEIFFATGTLFGTDYLDDIDAYAAICAYLGISRTDNPGEAIRGLLKYKPENGFAPDKITVDGITYTKCGAEQVYDLRESYYLYQTTSLAAGDPITAIDFDNLCYAAGSKTAKTADKESANVGKTGFTTKVDGSSALYLHCFCDESKGYVGNLYFGQGDNYKETAIDLLNQGATHVLDIDLNDGTGHPIYLGYSKVSSGSVYDLTIVTGEQPELRDVMTKAGVFLRKECTINGMTYTPVLDGEGNMLCINEAENAYLYYRTQKNGGETPLSKIGVAERDRLPDNTNLLQPWEHVLTADGEKYNVNEGRYVYSDKSLKDSRVQLFALRNEKNGVYLKPGTEVTGGSSTEIMAYILFKMKKN